MCNFMLPYGAYTKKVADKVRKRSFFWQLSAPIRTGVTKTELTTHSTPVGHGVGNMRAFGQKTATH